MATEQQTLGSSSLLVDVTDTGHGIANPAAELAEAELVEADGKQNRLSRSSSLGQDPDQIEVRTIFSFYERRAFCIGLILLNIWITLLSVQQNLDMRRKIISLWS